MKLQYQPFCVCRKKYIAIYHNLLEENRIFIDSFDPTYYTVLADHHFNEVVNNSDNKDLHATQLKLLYSQALESFFAYLFGILQAPFCLVAWIQIYRPTDLKKLIQIVSAGSSFPYFKVDIGNVSWQSVARFLTPVTTAGKDYQEFLDNAETLLHSLYKDYVNDIYTKEYNSIKHGFRARPGGFRLLIGKNKDKLNTLGQSPYGSSFLSREDVGEFSKKSTVKILTFRRANVNWDPEYFRCRIALMKNLLGNIVNLVKVLYGSQNKDMKYWVCDNKEELRGYLLNRSGVHTFDMDSGICKAELRNSVSQLQLSHNVYYKQKIRLVEERAR